MNIELSQKQSLNIVMTPDLRQAINLLQYSTLGLAQFIKEQALENPFIELEEEVPEVNFSEASQTYRHKSRSNTNNEQQINLVDHISTNKDLSLSEYLLEQIRWLDITPRQLTVLRYLILNLDANGYLTLTCEDIALHLKEEEQFIHKCIHILHRLEPIGVGARTLKECLILQAEELFPQEGFIVPIISHYLDLLGERKWQQIAEELNISLNEVENVFTLIQSLNPKPGSAFISANTPYIIPDIIIEKRMAGYTISMNDTYLPKIYFNKQYNDLKSKNHETEKFLSKQEQKYNWLIKSIEQRRLTILKIMDVIVKKQVRFLEYGYEALKPMTLKEIADELGIHESTVSRATNNKFIHTPIGTFELRTLFTSKLEQNNGSDISSMKIKILLKQIIEKENKRKPYSDQKIVQFLKDKQGISVSRRTIAKYRDELNILPSSKRKLII